MEEVPKKNPKRKRKIKCEVWSRVVGYYSTTDKFNAGKKEEFKERKPYSVEKSHDTFERMEREKEIAEIVQDGME